MKSKDFTFTMLVLGHLLLLLMPDVYMIFSGLGLFVLIVIAVLSSRLSLRRVLALFIVFGLTRSVIRLNNYRIAGEMTDRYIALMNEVLEDTKRDMVENPHWDHLPIFYVLLFVLRETATYFIPFMMVITISGLYYFLVVLVLTKILPFIDKRFKTLSSMN